MVEQALHRVAVQTNTVGGRFGAQQTAAGRLADVGAADPRTVGRINVEIEQARGWNGGFDSQTHRFHPPGVGCRSDDPIGAERILARGQGLANAKLLVELSQSPGEQSGAAGWRFIGAGNRTGNGHQRACRTVQQRGQRRLAGIAGGQQFRS